MRIAEVADNPTLLTKVRGYWEGVSGLEMQPARYAKLWAAVDDGRVVGISALRMLPDVEAFYTMSPRAAAMMFRSTTEWLQQQRHHEAAVYLEPGAEARYRSFLNRLDASPITRYVIYPMEAGS